MSVKALITGGSGFIGTYLGQLLIKEGYSVTGTSLYDGSCFSVPGVSSCAVSLVKCNVQDVGELREVLERVRPELVFHLAAQSFPTISYTKPVETLTTNVIGTANLLEAIKELKLNPVVVLACSSAEYGMAAMESPVTEEVPLLPLHPYGVSKVAQDLLGYVYFKSYGMKCVRVRIFNTTGPGKVGDVCSDFTKQVAAVEQEPGEVVINVGNLKTSRDITDVRDVVKGLFLLAQRGEPGDVYNLCSSRAYKVSEILGMILSLADKDITHKVIGERLRPVDEPVILGNNQKIRRLGWSPEISLHQTLRDMLDYWRAKL